MTQNAAMTEPPSPSRQPLAELSRLIRPKKDERDVSAQSRHYSFLVRKLRLILPLVIVAIFVALLAWSDSDKTVKAVPKEDVSPETMGKNELLNPKFEAEDEKQQPYTITATKAFQEPDNLDLVILDKPVADISLKDGSWIALESQDGKFTQSAGDLSLDGDVKLYHDDGYELRTSHVDINIRDQVVTSTSPVSGQGPAGDITASGLTAKGQDGTLVFTGPAKLVLRPQQDSKKENPKP
jgi:lipopolysaccharide export system protein LptC